MSTSRKLRAKLAKHRCSARKATSTEAARKEPEPEPTNLSTNETQTATQRGTVTTRSALTCTQFVCFCHWLPGQKLFAGLSLFTCTFQSRCQACLAHRGRQRQEALRAASLRHRNVPWEPPQQVGSVKNLAIYLSHSNSEIWPNIHFFFYTAVSAHPLFQGSHATLPLHRPFGASCTWSIRRTRPLKSRTRFTKSGPCSTECLLSFAATTAPDSSSASTRA